MRLAVVLVLLPLLAACDPGAGAPAVEAASDGGGVRAEQAAQQTCGTYGEAFLWDSREIDTDDDGVGDFTEVFAAEGAEERLARMVGSVAGARADARFASLVDAVDLVVSVFQRGGDRSEVLDAEVAMTQACEAVAARRSGG
jgi:hypothetical protein